MRFSFRFIVLYTFSFWEFLMKSEWRMLNDENGVLGNEANIPDCVLRIIMLIYLNSGL